MNLPPIKANVTEIEINGMHILFSYKTPVAVIMDGNAYHTEHKWSRTTTRHITQWYRTRGITSWSTRPQEFFDRLIITSNELLPEVKI